MTRNAQCRKPSMTTTNKMFKEIVGSQLITELKRKKNEEGRTCAQEMD